MTTQAESFRYQLVQQLITSQIDAGALLPGDRLPSLRELHEKLGVSVTTVMRAYEELELSGHIETRPRSGHFVRARLMSSVPLPRESRPTLQPASVDRDASRLTKRMTLPCSSVQVCSTESARA